MVVTSLHLLHIYPPPNLTLPIPTNGKKTWQYTPLTSNIKNMPLWCVFDVWWLPHQPAARQEKHTPEGMFSLSGIFLTASAENMPPWAC